MVDIRSDVSRIWMVEITHEDKHGLTGVRTLFFVGKTIFSALEKAEQCMSRLTEEEELRRWVITGAHVTP